MTKINLIFNENRMIRKETQRIMRMAQTRAETVLIQDHLLYAGDRRGCYYDSERGCGCFWTGILDNKKELADLLIKYRGTAPEHPAQLLYELYEILSDDLFDRLEGAFAAVFIQRSQIQAVRDPMGVKIGRAHV